MVKFLLSSNAEIEQRSSSGQTPLHLAVLCGHVHVAEVLLERGADFQVKYYIYYFIYIFYFFWHLPRQEENGKGCLKMLYVNSDVRFFLRIGGGVLHLRYLKCLSFQLIAVNFYTFHF